MLLELSILIAQRDNFLLHLRRSPGKTAYSAQYADQRQHALFSFDKPLHFVPLFADTTTTDPRATLAPLSRAERKAAHPLVAQVKCAAQRSVAHPQNRVLQEAPLRAHNKTQSENAPRE